METVGAVSGNGVSIPIVPKYSVPAFKRLAHRDFKSLNVLISISQGRAMPKISDFGLKWTKASPQLLPASRQPRTQTARLAPLRGARRKCSNRTVIPTYSAGGRSRCFKIPPLLSSRCTTGAVSWIRRKESPSMRSRKFCSLRWIRPRHRAFPVCLCNHCGGISASK